MAMQKNQIILIGMPASGKTTIGRAAAEVLGCRFIDSDTVIREKYGCPLRDIISLHGSDGFLRIEGDVNLTLGNDGVASIIAPGGSIIYSEAAMEHFREVGTVVYLELSCDAVSRRLGDLALRGVVVPEGYTLRDLYNERCGLCRKWAHLTVHEAPDDSVRDVTESLCAALEAAGVRL